MLAPRGLLRRARRGVCLRLACGRARRGRAQGKGRAGRERAGRAPALPLLGGSRGTGCRFPPPGGRRHAGQEPYPTLRRERMRRADCSAAPGVGYASGLRAAALGAAGPRARGEQAASGPAGRRRSPFLAAAAGRCPSVCLRRPEGDATQGRSPSPRIAVNACAARIAPPRPAWGMPPACVRPRSARPALAMKYSHCGWGAVSPPQHRRNPQVGGQVRHQVGCRSATRHPRGPRLLLGKAAKFRRAARPRQATRRGPQRRVGWAGAGWGPRPSRRVSGTRGEPGVPNAQRRALG
jgi:hypothetical protein